MCLACAIPVRGRTLGAECLATALGPDVPVPKLLAREPGAAARTIARAAFGLAVVATILPWSRFGAGSEPFGAWTTRPRWSMVVAGLSVAGLLLSLARRWSRSRASAWDVASVVGGGMIAVGSVLALTRPPAFTSPWLGPWVSLAAGIAAGMASFVALRGPRIRAAVHV